MRRKTLAVIAGFLTAVFVGVSAASAGIFGNPGSPQNAQAFAASAPLETPTTILIEEPRGDDLDAIVEQSALVSSLAPPSDEAAVDALPEPELTEVAELPALDQSYAALPARPGLPAELTAPLPVPVPAPTQSYFDEPIIDLGQIAIPKIGLDVPMGEGVSLNNIDRGPSLWPGSALPGEMGNAVIAGHRVTKGGPFRNIDQLVAGDQVIFTVDGQRSVYEVFDTEIVTPDALYILDQTREYTATLFACHPPGSAKFRIVVKLRLVDSKAISVDANST